jgi:hypothetical protein
MTRRLAVIVAMLALEAGATSLHAQRLRGQLFLPDSTTPAKGAIVVATGDNGALVRRALSNELGTFDLPLPHGGHWDVRALRIGFRPTTVHTPDIAADETRSLRIVLGAEATVLARVTVRGEDVCKTGPESGAVVARAWEEARKALMASGLSVTGAPLVAQWIVFDRTLDPTARIVREQHVQTTIAPTTHAFTSWPAESLATRGYIVAESGNITHYAPDANVLLSESFASLHCFHMEPPPSGHGDLVGVGFRPAREERGQSDIEGTLWLDRQTSQLRWLEYHYTGVPAAAERAGVGGRVEFLLLESGSWLVSRWNIRMARLAAPERNLDGGAVRRVIIPPSEATVRGVSIAGGEVTRVYRGDSLKYQAKGNIFDAQLVSKDPSVPVAFAAIKLLGSDYETDTDSMGRAQLTPVLEGRYRLRVATPLMEAMGVAVTDREVEIRSGAAHVDSIALPSMGELMRMACSASMVQQELGLLYGSVRDSAGHSAAHAVVTVRWQADFKRLIESELAATEKTAGVLTDNNGNWRLCGVPLRSPLLVRVTTDSGTAERKTRIEPGAAPILSVDLVLKRGMNAQAAPSGDVTRAVVEIAVSDPAGVPLPDVTLDITPPNGAARKLVTNESGRALLVDVEPGVLRVRARSVGYKAGELTLSVAAGRNTAPIILDKVRQPSLDTVRVIGDRRVLARHDEFETRRLLRQATTSITREEIEKRNPVSTWQMLTNVPSIKVADQLEAGSPVVVAVSTRAMIVNAKGGPCYVKVMVDGVLLPADDATGRTNLSNLPAPQSIHGIEVFAGGASIPPQYSGAGAGKWCGLIAVWTR